MRFLVARALARRPRYLVVRDPDAPLGPSDVGAFLALLRAVARAEHLGIVVSLAAAAPAGAFADRLAVLNEGLLVFHGRAGVLGDTHARERAGALTR
jgi:ABC-type branched-subunit amino acid transport system ATPase component